MRIISTLSSLLKGKALVAVLAAALVAGGGAAMAATPMGQNAIHSMNNTHSDAAAHPDKDKSQNNKDDQNKDKDDANAHATDCSAMPAVKQLATEFGLSTAATSNSIKTICALHDGSFKGTTTAGASVSSTRVFGLGEIEALLAMAKHNSGTSLTDASVQAQVANVLQHCGSKAAMECVKSDMPNFHPTPGNGNNDHGNHGKN